MGVEGALTTVEIIVEEAYWDPDGHQAYKLAVFNNGHSR